MFCSTLTVRIQIVLYFTPEKMKPALQCLKTFFLQARLCELYVFCHIKPEILLIFLDLVAEKSFENVYVMDNRKCNMDLWVIILIPNKTTSNLCIWNQPYIIIEKASAEPRQIKIAKLLHFFRSIWTEWIRKIRSQYLEFPSTMTSLNKGTIVIYHNFKNL